MLPGSKLRRETAVFRTPRHDHRRPRFAWCPGGARRGFAGVSAMSNLSRRELMGYSATFGSAFLAAQGLLSGETRAEEQEPGAKKAPRASGKKYEMKKSINLWALPYPQKMTL